jgi:hypothetical protein
LDRGIAGGGWRDTDGDLNRSTVIPSGCAFMIGSLFTDALFANPVTPEATRSRFLFIGS